jgi:hypothetical protein
VDGFGYDRRERSSSPCTTRYPHVRPRVVGAALLPGGQPNLGYEYAKVYAYSDRFHGRVTRLFITPLVTLLKMIGYQPFLVSRQLPLPLASEFA